MSALGSILAAVEAKVREVLADVVARLENLEQSSATGAACDDQFAEVNRRLDALEAKSTTAKPRAGQSVSARAQTAHGRGTAGDN